MMKSKVFTIDVKVYEVKVCEDGTKKWYMNGKLHREGGLPAVEWSDGQKEWYRNGRRLSRKPSCGGKIVKINGKKYRLTAV